MIVGDLNFAILIIHPLDIKIPTAPDHTLSIYFTTHALLSRLQFVSRLFTTSTFLSTKLKDFEKMSRLSIPKNVFERYQNFVNHIGSVMVSVPSSSAVDLGFEPR